MSADITHIFIVGASRSGTKFLMNTLNQHSAINISPETHFFSSLIHKGFVKVARSIGNLKEDENLIQLLNKMYERGIFGTFWKSVPVKREVIARRFYSSDREFRSLFQILLDQHRLDNHKAIAGEKTPSHLFHLQTLFEWFPEARALQIIRDPRAVLSSEIHKDAKPDYPIPKGNIFYNLGLLFSVTISWYLVAQKDRSYRKLFPERYQLVKYEELSGNHENCVRQVCQFLGVPYEESMLNPPEVDSSYHNPGSGNSDWQEKLPKWMQRAVKLMLRSKMKAYGYQ